MIIEPCTSLEREGWLPLRQASWPHCLDSEHLAEMAEFLDQPERFAQFVAYTEAHQPAGFVEASLRSDHVNGTESSPVAFLEGLYVAPMNRCGGVARSLVATVAEWAASHACQQFASDAALDNELSHQVHRALGFTETERVVYFCKQLSVK